MKENRCLNPKAFSWQPFVPESEREKENFNTPEAYTFYVWIDVRIDPSISVGLSRRKREFVMVSDEIERHLFQFQRMRRRPKTIQVIFVSVPNLQSESFNLLSLMCVCVCLVSLRCLFVSFSLRAVNRNALSKRNLNVKISHQTITISLIGTLNVCMLSIDGVTLDSLYYLW